MNKFKIELVEEDPKTITAALFKIVLPASGGSIISVTEMFNNTGQVFSIRPSTLGPNLALGIQWGGPDKINMHSIECQPAAATGGLLFIGKGPESYSYQNDITAPVFIGNSMITVWPSVPVYLLMKISIFNIE